MGSYDDPRDDDELLLAPALAWLLGIARNKLRASARRGSVEIEARQRLGIPAIAFEDEDILRVQELASAGDTRVRATRHWNCSISSLVRNGTRFARESSRSWTTSGSRWSSGIPSKLSAST